MISGHDTSPVFAVGSLSHLMLIDDRDPNTTDITSVKVLEPAQGIRYVIIVLPYVSPVPTIANISKFCYSVS